MPIFVKKDGEMKEIRCGGNGGGGSNVTQNYSTTEQPVLNPDGSQKLWIDGKPIYQRTFQGEVSSYGTEVTVQLLPAGSNISWLVSSNGHFDPGDNDLIPLGQTSLYGGDYWMKLIYVRNSRVLKLVCVGNSSKHYSQYSVTFQYTKDN